MNNEREQRTDEYTNDNNNNYSSCQQQMLFPVLLPRPNGRIHEKQPCPLPFSQFQMGSSLLKEY